MWLFLSLLLLLIALPLAHASTSALARPILGGLHAAILIAAVAVMGRTRGSIALAVLLAAPAVGLQIAALMRDDMDLLVMAWALAALVYFVTLGHLMRYVFSPASINEDKLFGAAAAYLMIGISWAFFYGIVQYLQPGSFAVQGAPADALTMFDFTYYSFTVLTSTGFGDILPILPLARSLTNLQSICGILFVAILIARLAGVYPGTDKQ